MLKARDLVVNIFGEACKIIKINFYASTALVIFEDGYKEEWDLDELTLIEKP